MGDTQLYATALKTGVGMERARIIELLKKAACNCEPDCNLMPNLIDLIELIKEGTN